MVRKAISKHIGGFKEALTIYKKKKVHLGDFKNKGGTKIIDKIKWKMGGYFKHADIFFLIFPRGEIHRSV